MKISAKTLLTVLLMLSMVFIIFSCKNLANSNEDNPTSDNSVSVDGNSNDGTTNVENPTETEIPFPYDPIDLGGATFKILTGQQWASDNLNIEDYDIEEMNGEVLNDAIYKRNLIIKEMFNLKFETVHANDQIGSFISKSIQSGIDEYDAVAPLLNNAESFAENGYAVNIYQTKLSIDAPWWDQNILKSTSIGGAAYYIAGDIFIKHYDGLALLMFNKKMLADLGLDSPYGYVENNEWTMDKFNEMVKGVYLDLDNNGKRNRYDRYGFATQVDYLISFVNGSGQLFMDKDKNDLPVFVGYNEKMSNILDKMLMHYASDDTYCIHRDASKEGGWNAGNIPQTWVFPEGRALFYWGLPRYINLYLRDMEDDFGILPIPKWDSSQDRYYSTVNGWNSYTFMLPRTVSDIEKNSVVLDAMAYYGRQLIKPAYYDICLQRKYTRDEESGAMLDIIFSSAHYEPAGAGVFIDALCNAIQTNKINIASIYEKNSGKIDTAIQQIIDEYKANS
ncbi:MAG: hypothetical protein FWD71_09005 [Oscillospiraceae bacterium]|nr:hypothetical protein [Oscillospiraceae bacterium]